MSVTVPAARPHHGGATGLAPRSGEATPDGVDAELLRSVLRHHAKGVAIITAGLDRPVGFCATSFTSVSLDPPVMLFAIGRGVSAWPVIESAAHVVIHLLAEEQEGLARRFGQSGANRFGPETRWHRGAFGLPVLDDVLAVLVLAPTERLPVGDHALVIGRVVTATHGIAGEPLVHHNGGYGRLA